MLLHQALEVGLEDAGDLNRKLLDAQRSVLLVRFLALAALLHIGTVSQGVSGLFGLLIVVPGQQLGYVAAMLLAYAAGFVLTWFFGVDEQKINEFFGE